MRVQVKTQNTDLNAQCGHVLLLKLPSEVTLDESGLAGAAVSDQDQLEGWHVLTSSHGAGAGLTVCNRITHTIYVGCVCRTCLALALHYLYFSGVTKTILFNLVDLPWWGPFDEVGVH